MYNSETDYPIVLEACRRAGEISIAAPLLAVEAARHLDKDICRAWMELGYRNGTLGN